MVTRENRTPEKILMMLSFLLEERDFLPRMGKDAELTIF